MLWLRVLAHALVLLFWGLVLANLTEHQFGIGSRRSAGRRAPRAAPRRGR